MAIRGLVATLAGLALGSGCASRTTELKLEQPFAPPTQQSLQLASRWAFSDVRDGRQRVLLAFPLPGAEDGPRDFLVYLDMPDRDGDLSVGAADVDAGRGFLIQAVGELRGRTVFRDGRLRRTGVALQPRYRRLTLELECADGTRVSGTAYVQAAPHELRIFEEMHSADIATLGGATASAPTGDRGAGGAAATEPAAAPPAP